MNKFKLPLFAVIAAGIVNCGGRGGGSSASDNASDVADNFVNNTFCYKSSYYRSCGSG